MSQTPDAGPPPDGKDPPLEALLAAYLPELQGYLRRRSQGLVAARESSSDLVQSVCREILTNMDRFRHGANRGHGRIRVLSRLQWQWRLGSAGHCRRNQQRC